MKTKMSFLTSVGIVFLSLISIGLFKNLPQEPKDSKQWDILMRDAKPLQPDSYLCTAYPVDYDEAFIYKFEALADASTAHHMLLYGCNGPEVHHTDPLWNCPSMCAGRAQTIMFAWAKNAPPTVLPKDVGLKIGKNSRIKTIVLQIHYAKSFKEDSQPDDSGLRLYITQQRQLYSAGILLMLPQFFMVPPHQSSYPVDMGCQYTNPNTIYPFAYRTHAHGLGKVITGYQYNGSYHLIGKGNPQWPQAFYSVKHPFVIKQNDYLAGRCTYDSSKMDKVTSLGGSGSDEMCNFYIMYYTDSSASEEPFECFSNGPPFLTGNNFPLDVSVPLPHNATLEAEAMHHHHGGGGNKTTPSAAITTTSLYEVVEVTKPLGPKTENPQSVHIEKKLVYQPSWPAESLNIGQVGGVSTDQQGNVYIFHRAYRKWNIGSFGADDNFLYPEAPIDQNVVMILSKTGKQIRQFGKGMFFMPHGITVDSQDNIWLTDVALHQVFKFPKDKTEPTLTLGHRFKHGEDPGYFCKPADVAILSTGEFFIADGYCNSRILKYSKDGKLLKAWGRKNMDYDRNPKPMVFDIVHNIAVSEKDKLVCAADRENGRIQCFDLDGNFKHVIKHKEFGQKLFALEYCPKHGGILYAVNGPSYDGHANFDVQGFTMEIKNGALIDTWNLPQHLKTPHDICVDPTSESVYVGELDPSTVYKLTRMTDEEAKNVYVDLNLNHGDDDDDHHDDGQKQKDDDKPKSSTTSPSKVVDVTNGNNNTSMLPDLNKSAKNENEDGFNAPMIMGLMLIVPVILILVFVLLYKSGNLNCLKANSGHKRIFNMQHILGNSHKGFDPLSTEESDHDLDPDDSDQEEYAAPRKPKT